MSSHLIPEKVQVVNLPKQWIPEYYTSEGVSEAASAADQMYVPGFGTTKISQVKKLGLFRGTDPVQNVYRVLFSAAADAGLPANTKVYFDVDVETTNREFRLARPEYEFGQTLSYQIAVSGSEAATSLATKFAADVNSNAERERDFLITASVVNSSAVQLTVAQPEGYSTFFRGTFIDGITVLDEQGNTSSDITYTATETTPAFKGIGYGSDIEFKESLQSMKLTPYHHDNQEVPEEDSLYTVVSWEFDINRPDPKDPLLSNRLRHVVYIKESNSTLNSRVEDMATFFLTSASVRGAYESIYIGASDADTKAVLTGSSTAITGDYKEYAFPEGTILNNQAASALGAFNAAV